MILLVKKFIFRWSHEEPGVGPSVILYSSRYSVILTVNELKSVPAAVNLVHNEIHSSMSYQFFQTTSGKARDCVSQSHHLVGKCTVLSVCNLHITRIAKHTSILSADQSLILVPCWPGPSKLLLDSQGFSATEMID